jgi:hypothetical protein
VRFIPISIGYFDQKLGTIVDGHVFLIEIDLTRKELRVIDFDDRSVFVQIIMDNLETEFPGPWKLLPRKFPPTDKWPGDGHCVPRAMAILSHWVENHELIKSLPKDLLLGLGNVILNL